MPPPPIEPVPIAEIARAEEARIALSVGDIAPERRPFAGGVMTRGKPGEWLNAAFGAGMSGRVEREEVRELVAWYESAGIEPRVELCPFADRTLIELLAAERFSIRLFEQVFYRTPDAIPPVSRPADLQIEPVDPRDDALVERYAQLAIQGFVPPSADDAVRDAHRATWQRVIRHPRTVATIAWLGASDSRTPAGVACAEVADVPGGPIAALFGATVLEPYRRRGIQQALLADRLHRAAASGARYATIGGRPGEATERNVRRMGFTVAYTKAIVSRPAAGLVSVAE